VRPTLRFLSDELIDRILGEAREVLDKLGVVIQNEAALSLLADRGARIDRSKLRAFIPGVMIDRALATSPRSFRLFDTLGRETHDFSGDSVYFTPGSAALHILDPETGELRKPTTRDYVRYAKLVSGLPHIASQSTAFIPADVPERVSDSYRLFLSLLYCKKPVVTGTFTAQSFAVMRDMQVAVRGSSRALEEKPLTVFSCCPTSPLKWSDITSQNVIDCASSRIPIEFIAMPLSGFLAPVTITGTLVQHTAETLSGIVLAQCARPGAPMLYGGSPAPFDIRYETTPMGAVETEMIDCAYNEIGKRLGLPTQAYIALSDSKRLDCQAGLETAMGAVLAALSGINNISGPGMLDFESCQSLEKLVVDNEICGMVLRLVRGIEPRDDFPALPRFEELLRDQHLLVSEHTRRHLVDEHFFPGPVIDRANLSRWMEDGGRSLIDRAREEVEARIAKHEPPAIDESVRKELIERMEAEAKLHGLESLPGRE
jgi:trimethylamine--corrinoid protein Co-methyltransferase